MICVTAESIYESWVKIVDHCTEFGRPGNDGDVKIKEVLGVGFSIEKPRLDDELALRFGKKEMIEAMVKNFTTDEPQFGFKFSYGARIFSKTKDEGFSSLISILKNKPEAKSATMSLLRTGDHLGTHVPCITTIDFKIRDGKLQTHYFARSQDVFKKNYADNLAILSVAKKASDELGVKLGSISGYIASAHIYEVDFKNAEALIGLQTA